MCFPLVCFSLPEMTVCLFPCCVLPCQLDNWMNLKFYSKQSELKEKTFKIENIYKKHKLEMNCRSLDDSFESGHCYRRELSNCISTTKAVCEIIELFSHFCMIEYP